MRGLSSPYYLFELAFEAALNFYRVSVVDNQQDYGEVCKQVLGAFSGYYGSVRCYSYYFSPKS